MLAYSEADAIKRILRHHHAHSSPLAGDLETLLEWVHKSEQARTALIRGTSPMPLISVLGNMGIYGAEVLSTVGGDDDAGCQDGTTAG